MSEQNKNNVVNKNSFITLNELFNAAKFTANGAMTWTVESTDVNSYKYILINKIMTLWFDIVTTTIGGTLNTTLFIQIPGGYLAKGSLYNLCFLLDNGVPTTCFIRSGNSSNKISITRTDFANFTASVNNTKVQGQLTFEVL